MDQRLDKYLEQFLVIFQVLLHIHHAFLEGAVVLLLFDFEKVIVVAAFLAIVFGYHVHRFNRARGRHSGLQQISERHHAAPE